MTRLPSTAILGISMISFSGLLMFASVKHYQTASNKIHSLDAELSEILSFSMGILCAFAGIIVHLANLDTEPLARSYGFGFIMANATFVYVYFMVEPAEWMEWLPLVFMISVVELVVGLITYDGDPQVDKKRTAALEDQAKMRLVEADELKVKWQKLVDEQKLKAEGFEKID